MLNEEFKQEKIQQTEARLNQHGFTLDNLEGVVTTIDRKHVIHRHGVTLHVPAYVNTFEAYRDAIAFSYNTAKNKKDGFPHTAPGTHTFEEWFAIFEDIAGTLAAENGLPALIVDSGRKDQAFLESNGYTRIRHTYSYKKTI